MSIFRNLLMLPKGNYIKFEDPLVEAALLKQININPNQDKHITYKEAANATSVNLNSLSNITRFPEFKYFTKLTETGNSSFMSSSLRYIELPPNITKISDDTFKYTSGITFPDNGLDNITVIGKRAFQNVSTNFINCFPKNIISIELDGFMNSAVSLTTLPDTLTTLNDAVFMNCGNVKLTSLPDNLKSFGARCFQNTGVIINHLPPKITSAPNDSFRNCKQLVIDNIDKLTYIGERTFQDCTKLNFTKLNDSIKTIYGSAFQGCTNIGKIQLPNSLTTITYSAFQGCKNLDLDSIPRMVSVGNTAFYNCTNLHSISSLVLDSVGVSAFENTGLNLTSLSCVNIAYKAFKGTNINKIKLESVNVIEFTNVSTNNDGPFNIGCEIYVPANLLNSYLNHTNWKNSTEKEGYVWHTLDEWTD